MKNLKRNIKSSLILIVLSLSPAFLDAETQNQDELNNQLVEMAEVGNTVEVSRLLKLGADVNAKTKNGRTALYLASWKGHTEVVKLLLEKGADVNARNNDGKTAHRLASRNEHTDVVKLLKLAGASFWAEVLYILTYPVRKALEVTRIVLVVTPVCFFIIFTPGPVLSQDLVAPSWWIWVVAIYGWMILLFWMMILAKLLAGIWSLFSLVFNKKN